MPNCKLFDSFIWRLDLPEPFNDSSIPVKSKEHISAYANTGTSEATLHAPTLRAIMAFYEVCEKGGKGALGIQGENKYIAEFHNNISGEIEVVIFNRTNGKFTSGIFEDPTSMPGNYELKEHRNSGEAMIFAIMPILLEDLEFSERYTKFKGCADTGFSDLESAAEQAYILCDNCYRRLENASIKAAIKLSIQATGNVSKISKLSLDIGTNNPTDVIYGDFEILKPGKVPDAALPKMNHDDFVSKYAFSSRKFSPEETDMIPKLSDTYIIPPEVIMVCEHAKKTHGTNQPLRNFMFRGEAGTGKTSSAAAIAAGLGLPYTFLTCSANSEIYDFVGQILPAIDRKGSNENLPALPTLEDIQMDPSTAYHMMTGLYNDDVSEEDVYNKLLETIRETGVSKDSEGNKFSYCDSELVRAMEHGYLIEIQEPSVISNPGVLVGLNGMLDNCSKIKLPTGEVIDRHPDCIIIVTTNNDYNGCKNMNQSVISRMDMIIDIDDLDVVTMMERATSITKCSDTFALKKMAEAVKTIAERCREIMITDGCCGFREYLSWVQSYMITEDFLKSAKHTILASVSADKENREEIYNTCLEPQFEK